MVFHFVELRNISLPAVVVLCAFIAIFVYNKYVFSHLYGSDFYQSVSWSYKQYILCIYINCCPSRIIYTQTDITLGCVYVKVDVKLLSMTTYFYMRPVSEISRSRCYLDYPLLAVDNQSSAWTTHVGASVWYISRNV